MGAYYLLAIVALLFPLLAVSDVGGSDVDPSWVPIKNLSDPHVIEVAKFAIVQNYKKTGKQFPFRKVAEASYWKQQSEVVKYHLLIYGKSFIPEFPKASASVKENTSTKRMHLDFIGWYGYP
ncbi:hypothetical protein ACLB2K_011712 [Fragaria x ananassa]